VGSLERRARRLEEDAEWREIGERLEKERTFREALTRLSTSELQAMREYFDSTGREEWAEKDVPLMLRLLGLMEEVRREGAEARGEVVDPPWLSEIKSNREERKT
jgi:hypothetical protein